MGSTILIADDNPEIREIVNVLLSSEGHTIIEAKNGEEVIHLVNEDIDLIILDIMMPKMNGYQSCVEIRKITNAPILFLSAKGQESDKTLGFSSGGDDYLTKPFSYNELNARVKALLRRYQVYQGKEKDDEIVNETPTHEVISLGYLALNPHSEDVTVHGKHISLTDIEYQILCLLITHRRQIFSSKHLFETIWKEDYYYSANNTVMVHIRNLRKKIEQDPQNPTIIKTIWGKGYRCD